jgi:hypothetical protein
MSRIRVTIDEIAFRGIEPSDRTALVEGFEAELTRMLRERSSPSTWNSRRTPVMKLGAMPFEPGPSSGRRLGAQVARGIEKGLK